jgi:hypothetical protein
MIGMYERPCRHVVEDASMADEQIPEPSEETKDFARYVAMVIRNAMEDFHCEHLSDEQMKQLNPIVRNAVCTAFHAFQNYERSARDKQFVDFQVRMLHYNRQGRLPQ